MSGQLTDGRKCTFNHHSFTPNSFMDAVPTRILVSNYRDLNPEPLLVNPY